MPLYRVLPGFEHGARGQHKAGDVVEHTEQEAAGFMDKLELVVPVSDPPPPVTTEATVAEVLKAVEDGMFSAADALTAEKAGRRRKTLIEALEAQLEPDSD